MLPSSTLDEAKRSFESKFKDKTSNAWASKASFQFVSGKYDLVRIDYAADDTDKIEEALAVPKPPKKIVVRALAAPGHAACPRRSRSWSRQSSR